jgi:hypothetical protein
MGALSPVGWKVASFSARELRTPGAILMKVFSKLVGVVIGKVVEFQKGPATMNAEVRYTKHCPYGWEGGFEPQIESTTRE